jgi:hypothetical protein
MFHDVEALCELRASELASADVATLYGACLQVGQAFRVSGAEGLLLVLFAVAGLVGGLVARRSSGRRGAPAVGGAVETMLYAAAGVYFGSAGGLLFALLLGPVAFGVLVALLAVGCLVGVVLGLMHGDGGALKVLGVLALVAVAAALAFGAHRCWQVGEADVAARYQGFVNAAALVGGTVAGLNGLIVGVTRAAHPALGWLVVPVVSLWGLLGTTLGLLMHLASWLFFADFGGPRDATERSVIEGSRRNGLTFVAYANGVRVMPGFFFTQGGVMTAWTTHGVWHEAVHVLQHVLFGPLFVLSYVVWLLVMGAAGFVVGLVRSVGGPHGAFAWGYLNNPWEVWEYRTAWHGQSAMPRTVTWADPAHRTAMVFAEGPAMVVTVLWIAAWAVAFALWLVGVTG